MGGTDILVSGASIAGPALAYWLRRNGFTPTVVERAPTLRPGGQAVDLRGASREVVRRMGLMPAVKDVLVPVKGYTLIDSAGRHRVEMPVDAFGGEGLMSEIEVLRGDLSRVFYDATRDDVEYLFDDEITALDEEPDGVAVTFHSGTSRRFGLVVGADGLHSVVRRLAFGPESDYVNPLGGYLSYCTVPAGPLDLDRWFVSYNLPGGRVVSVRPDSKAGSMKAMLAFRSAPLEQLRPGYDRRDVAAQRRIVAATFTGAGWHTPYLLDAMADSPDFFFDTLAQARVPQLSRGRAALVGDAGHCPSPLTGLGTALAVVGGYLLAGELAAAGGDHSTAFAAYERRMRPYITQGQKLPPGGIRGFAPRTRTGIRAVRMSMASMRRWPMRSILEKQFQKADAITLPDESWPAA